MDLETLAVKIQSLEDQCKTQSDKIESLESKMNFVVEQVTMGKHMLQFAKLMGWFIGVLATGIEVWRAIKGGGNG